MMVLEALVGNSSLRPIQHCCYIGILIVNLNKIVLRSIIFFIEVNKIGTDMTFVAALAFSFSISIKWFIDLNNFARAWHFAGGDVCIVVNCL